MLEMMNVVASAAGGLSSDQGQYVEEMRELFVPPTKTGGTWG